MPNEQDRHIIVKLKPGLAGQKIADAVDVEVNSVFTGNLENMNVTDVETLADVVDGLTLGDGTGGTMAIPHLGELVMDIDSRVDIGTDLSGPTAFHYRVYNHALITSLNLFVNEGGVFLAPIAISLPTGDGTHSESVLLPNITTSTKRKLSFTLIANNRFPSNSDVVQINDIDGEDVKIDRTSLSTVQGDDAQDMANELERLYGIVRAIQEQIGASTRPLNTFNSSVTIVPGNVGDFINKNSLYVRADNARVNFVLPAESTILGQYPAIFEVQHFGGTERIDSGGGFAGPDNTIRITRPVDYNSNDPSTFLRRNTEDGANLQFTSLHLGDTAIVTKQDADSPWIVIESSTDPRTSILPNGVFQFNSRGITFPTNINGDHIIGGLSLYTPTMGDAFEVVGSGIAADSSFGRVIETGDVLVALVDAPSIILTVDNNDWLILRNFGHGELTMRELRFLATLTETDSTNDVRLVDDGATEALVWLSPEILATAPFLIPTTDTSNPRSPATEPYIGGRELLNSNNDFQHSSNDFQSLLYIGINPNWITNNTVDDVYVQIIDLDGNIVNDIKLTEHFVKPTFADNSTVRYWAYSRGLISDSFTQIRYIANQTIKLIRRNTTRAFGFNSQVDTTPNVNNLLESQFSQTVQAKLNKESSISVTDRVKLDAVTTVTESDAIDDRFDYLLKYGEISHLLSDYHSINNFISFIGEFDATDIVIVISGNATITQLDWSRGSIPVTELTPSLFEATKTYQATIPAFSGSFNQTPLDFPITLNATVNNTQVSGMANNWKVRFGNLSQDIIDSIHTTPPSTLPEVLTQLSADLSVITIDNTVWTTTSPSPIPATLTRIAAALWDENRRTFGNENYFEDLLDVEVIGFASNTIFYYQNPTDPLNRTWNGKGSYVENDNVRVRNKDTKDFIKDTWNKIISFEYQLENTYFFNNPNGDPMLRLGNANEPLIRLDSEGLVVRVGNGDGGQRSRTYDESLSIDNVLFSKTFSTRVGETTNAEAEINIPSDVTGSLDVTVHYTLWNNGNNEGTFDQTINIPNVGTDITQYNIVFNFGTINGINYGSQTVAIRYEHNNTDLSNSRRVLFFIPPAMANAALSYELRASRSITQTWTEPATYADYTINAGSGHDSNGLFDPSLYDTTQTHHTNDIILSFRPTVTNDPSNDPELTLLIVVDGEVENAIDLNRPASDFDFTDINFGNSETDITHIQIYEWDNNNVIAHTPTHQNLVTLYNARDRWLGAFTHPTNHVDTFKLNANLEFPKNDGVIMVNPNTDERIHITMNTNSNGLVFTKL